jgi:hypothetical protein
MLAVLLLLIVTPLYECLIFSSLEREYAKSMVQRWKPRFFKLSKDSKPQLLSNQFDEYVQATIFLQNEKCRSYLCLDDEENVHFCVLLNEVDFGEEKAVFLWNTNDEDLKYEIEDSLLTWRMTT